MTEKMLKKIVKEKASESMDNMPPCKKGEKHKLIGKTEPKSMIITLKCKKCKFTRKLTVNKIEDSRGK